MLHLLASWQLYIISLAGSPNSVTTYVITSLTKLAPKNFGQDSKILEVDVFMERW